jgi:hypothetical protein
MQDDQITHEMSLEDNHDIEKMLDVFRIDPVTLSTLCSLLSALCSFRSLDFLPSLASLASLASLPPSLVSHCIPTQDWDENETAYGEIRKEILGGGGSDDDDDDDEDDDDDDDDDDDEDSEEEAGGGGGEGGMDIMDRTETDVINLR